MNYVVPPATRIFNSHAGPHLPNIAIRPLVVRHDVGASSNDTTCLSATTVLLSPLPALFGCLDVFYNKVSLWIWRLVNRRAFSLWGSLWGRLSIH